MAPLQAKDVHPSLIAALGCHEGFRRLGFRPEDLFLMYQEEQQILFVVLKTQGQQFAVGVAPVPDKESKTLEQEWQRLVMAVRTFEFSEADLQTCWESSLPYANPEGFLLAILKKGIRLPTEEEKRKTRS
jgi:hypothetical protein